MTRRTPVWEAPTEITKLMGDVSGNELNGWGETEPRPPSLVMWANPAKLAHGAVQQKMTDEFLAHDELRTVLRTNDRHTPAEIASERVDRTPQQWAEALEHFAASEAGHRVELVGVAQVQTDWFFEGRSSHLPSVVLLALAMDHEQLATAPEHTSAMEVHRQYLSLIHI